MGYAICFSRCCSCGRIFAFNPVKVPSVRVNGVREPVCRACIDAANLERARRGLEPFEIPQDAYEPCAETDLQTN